MLIGIAGQAGAGKDTIGTHLRVTHGFVGLAFATPIKEIMASVFGFTHNQLHGHAKEVEDEYWGASPRELLQLVGTELFRVELPKLVAKHLAHRKTNIDEAIWVRSFELRMARLPRGTNIVITDVRFANEAEFIWRRGGRIWHVSRPGAPLVAAAHASEADNVPHDEELVNDGTVHDLYRAADIILDYTRRRVAAKAI